MHLYRLHSQQFSLSQQEMNNINSQQEINYINKMSSKMIVETKLCIL